MHQSSRRVVTDVSGSSSGRNNSSSAGSGDGGNSNMGTTSSSGNDAGGKNESSEELGAKGEEEDGTNDKSESMSGSSDGKPKASLLPSSNKTSDALQAEAVFGAHNPPFGILNNNSHPPQQMPDRGSQRERKLHDKKRRRLEMRREYEAQQQFDSSETSDVQEKYFKPGRMVSMDDVLVCSKIPR